MKYSFILLSLLIGLAGGGTAHAATSSKGHGHHHASTTTPAPGSDAETADLNAISLKKARASLATPPVTTQATRTANGKPQAVQAAGTGTTSPPIRIPETSDTVAMY